MEDIKVKEKKTNVRSALFVLLKVVFTAAAAAATVFVGSLLVLLLADQDVHLILTYVAGYLPLALLLPLIWLKKRKKYVKLWLLVVALCAVAVGANIGVAKYNASITVDTTRYLNIINRLGEYNPFDEDSRVVKADSKTLEFKDDLPVIDGTIAFHPLYCAFVHAVFPESNDLYYGSFDHVESWGYSEMAEKNTDIFINLEYPTEEQKAEAAACSTVYEFTTIGTEALVFIVDRDNPIDNLTTEQIRGIYSGEITNWAQLGGKDKKIAAYQNAEGSSSQNRMESFMGDIALMEPPAEMGYGDLFAWEEDISPYRNKDTSIGYAFRFCVKDYEDIKFLSVDGAAPTQENIENGSYRVVSPVLAVTYEGNPNENADTMVEWMLSDEGQHIIRETGYFGVVSD